MCARRRGAGGTAGWLINGPAPATPRGSAALKASAASSFTRWPERAAVPAAECQACSTAPGGSAAPFCAPQMPRAAGHAGRPAPAHQAALAQPVALDVVGMQRERQLGGPGPRASERQNQLQQAVSMRGPAGGPALWQLPALQVRRRQQLGGSSPGRRRPCDADRCSRLCASKMSYTASGSARRSAGWRKRKRSGAYFMLHAYPHGAGARALSTTARQPLRDESST